jgi:hypothetical protein
MPRFKPTGALERNALADLWKHTLSGIPSTFGRLMCLAGLRDPHSGHYRHYGLSSAFGREESALALRQSHEQVFKDWLDLSLAEKSADLAQHLAALEDSPNTVASHWLRGKYYETLLPDRATGAQRAHFRKEVEMLLELIRNVAAAGQPSPGSAQPA